MMNPGAIKQRTKDSKASQARGGSIGTLGDIWQGGYADLKTSPFDEAIKKKWTDTWQFYANSIHFASAMGAVVTTVCMPMVAINSPRHCRK
jgi:hypothetical protein